MTCPPIYEVLNSRIQARCPYEALTVIVLRRRSDGVVGEIWLCAGIPEHMHDTFDATNDTFLELSGVWPFGDELHCWCPVEFRPDYRGAFSAAAPKALELWISMSSG
jgi:hypothetical protein